MNEYNPPTVSVIMPIKDEEKYIERSLGAVIDQDYPSDFMEILVIDGNSKDLTIEIIKVLSARSKYFIKVINNPSGIIPRALNLGIKNAKGDIVIRVDGHCEVQSDYVKKCVSHLLSGEADCVGGTIETIGETSMAQTIAMAMSTTFGVGNVDFRVSDGTSKLTDSVPFPAYKKTIFDRIGLFDEAMICNEDDEFNYRLLKMGGRILLVGDLKTRYFSRTTLSALWRQYFRYGMWKIRVMQKHPSQMKIRHFIPAIFISALAVSIIMTVIFSWGWFFLLGILALYFSFQLFSIFQQQKGKIPEDGINLLLAIMVLHFSYGIGFIAGLLKFMSPRKTFPLPVL